MSQLKRPLTINEQIQQLQNHGIIVNDEQAGRILQRVSYYRLSGYALQYRTGSDSHLLRSGVTLRNIYRAYCFDEELRDLFRGYLERIEYYYKCLIGNTFALQHCSEPPYDQHYDIQNYYNKDEIQRTLRNFIRERDYSRDSLVVRHHSAHYHNRMPLWVMIDLMTFSSVSMFYHAMYQRDKELIASAVGISSRTLENHLFCLSVLRNKCAHGSRLYNTSLNPPVRFTNTFLQRHPDVANNSVFAYMLLVFKRLPTDEDRTDFRETLYKLLDRYRDDIDLSLVGIPQNYRQLLIISNSSG